MNLIKELLHQIESLPETITAEEKVRNKQLVKIQKELVKQVKKVRAQKRRKTNDL